MAITAAEVKALRDRTGAGMMECKSVLVETNGDVEQAITVLRTRGLAQVAKKAGRSTSEGLVGTFLSDDGTVGVLVEVNCESDFVARTDDFQSLVRDAAVAIADAGDRVTDAWVADPNGPIGQRVAAAIAKLGENMAVPRFARYATTGVIGQYLHLGGKIGVMVEVAVDDPAAAGREEFRTLVKEIAMQVAAASPQYLTRDDVPADVLDREKAIYRGQMEGTGKPPAVVEKIVDGKLGSFFEQVVLVDQPSIREPKVKVAEVIAQAARTLGTGIRVARFARLKVGEAA